MQSANRRLAGLGLLAMLIGCGAGSDPSPDPDPGGGSATGTAVIGPAGGELMTSDSALVLTIPAGVLSTQTTITVTAEDPVDPAAIGKVYRIEPAGLVFSEPVKIEVGRDSATVAGLVPAALGLAFQDDTGAARANLTSQLVEDDVPASRVPLAITRNWYMALSGFWTNLPRYVFVRTFWEIRPDPTQVQAGRGITVEIWACTEEEDANTSWPTFRQHCGPSIRRGTWRVRPLIGNSSNLGSVVAGTPSSTARYTAPTHRPEPPIVKLEATLSWEARGVSTTLPIGVAILQAAAGAGTIQWSWSGSNSRNQTSADGRYSYTETVSDAGSGSATFDQLGQYAWILKTASYDANYQQNITVVNVGNTCTTTRTESITRVANDPGTSDPSGWIAAVLPNLMTGKYTLQPGGGSFTIKETRASATKTSCPGAPDIIVADPTIVTDGFDYVPLRFAERPMSGSDARQFTDSDSYRKDESAGTGLDYTVDVNWNWDLLTP